MKLKIYTIDEFLQSRPLQYPPNLGYEAAKKMTLDYAYYCVKQSLFEVKMEMKYEKDAIFIQKTIDDLGGE